MMAHSLFSVSQHSMSNTRLVLKTGKVPDTSAEITNLGSRFQQPIILIKQIVKKYQIQLLGVGYVSDHTNFKSPASYGAVEYTHGPLTLVQKSNSSNFYSGNRQVLKRVSLFIFFSELSFVK